jgi:hypothetical protein
MSVSLSRSFSFLGAGPEISIDLPPSFEGLPELSTPIANGVGARSFDFVPNHRDPGPPQGYELIRTLRGQDGVVAELYDWPYREPLQWFLRWPLDAGSIWTHLRAEDTIAQSDVIVRSLEIAVDGQGLPMVFPSLPMTLAVSARAGFQEIAAYFDATDPGNRITLQRPGYLSEGQSRLLPEGFRDYVLLRCGLSYGIEAIIRADHLERAEEILGGVHLAGE